MQMPGPGSSPDIAGLAELQREAVSLLRQLIAVPSPGREEGEAAAVVRSFFAARNIPFEIHLHNTWVKNHYYDVSKPTILLNSHIDTVPPNKAYTRDPFDATLEGDRLYGLGSNDAGGSLVALIAAFLHFYKEDIPYNIILAATAEEEISGKNGVESILDHIGEIAFGMVGEPTKLDLAVAERGLMVLDVLATGVAGHAAREEGENAICKAVEDILWFQSNPFEKVSDLLGPVKMSVTAIETANKAHNIVPSECRYVVDIRLNELYTHEEVLAVIREHIHGKATPRSMRIRSSHIPADHPLVRAGLRLGKKIYGSPTASDKALLPFPVLKTGPGDSARSHSADEFIYLHEIAQGIHHYISLLEGVFSETAALIQPVDHENKTLGENRKD